MKRSFGTRAIGGPRTAGSGPSAPVGATLAIADQADGTGATATIGGAAGYSNDVLVYQFSGSAGGLTLVDTFTRSGNGTLDLVLEPGSYFAELVSDDFAAAGPVFFAVTGDDQSDLGDILAAAAAQVQAIGLAGIDSVNVRMKKFAWRRAESIPIPGVLVCPRDEQFPNLGTNASDDTGYSVQISAVAASNSDNSLAQNNRLLAWRMAIAERFREKRFASLANDADQFTTRIEPGPVIDRAAFEAGYDATTVYLRVWVRKGRP